MSSSTLILSSPFVSALPSHLFFEYDTHGDVIMVDAATGRPIVYGGSVSKRKLLEPSGSGYDDSSDSGSGSGSSSKRSRSSSYNGGEATFASVCTPSSSAPPCPPAPLKVWCALPDDTKYTGLSRNLLDDFVASMASDRNNICLATETRAPVAPPAESLPLPSSFLPFEEVVSPAADSLPSLNSFLPFSCDDVSAAALPVDEDKDWYLTTDCHDLASLRMKDPLAFLYFLRFVKSYNEYALEGEEIKLPLIPLKIVNKAYYHPYFYTRFEELCQLDALLQHFPCKEGFLRGPAPHGIEEKVAAGEWNISLAYCSDLALPLDMGHPIVLLHFLRFVNHYNKDLPEDERIRLPMFSESKVEYIQKHSFFQNNNAEAEELILCLEERSYAEQNRNEWEDSDDDDDDDYEYNEDYEGYDCDDRDYHDGYDEYDYDDDYDTDYDNCDDDEERDYGDGDSYYYDSE